jgi:MFS-type transporter involved in bile tolerance (Atg22 family)
MLSTIVFFIIGLVGMAFVNEKRGHEEAEAWQDAA